MTITLILRPETEAELARQAALAGRALEIFTAELLDDTVQPLRPAAAAPESLEQIFAKARGLLTEEEVDTLFRRNPSTSRSVNFE